MATVPIKKLLEFSEAKNRKLSFCKASPGDFEDWIQHLPTMDALPLAVVLYNAMKELSQVKMNKLKFFKCLEIASPHIVDIEQQLSHRYLVQSAKLSEEQARAAELANFINSVIVKCYNRCLVEGLKVDEDWIVAVGRSMEWLLRLTYRRSALCLPLSDDATWRQLNAFYSFIQQRGWLGCTYELLFSAEKEVVKLQNIYAQCALLVCAQPLQLQKRQITELVELLPSIANLAKITSSKPHGKFLFTVDLDGDKPPQVYNNSDENVAPQQRFFDLENVHDAFLGSRASSKMSEDLVLHLKRFWNEAPSRIFERIDSRNSDINFTFGVKNVFSLLTSGLTPEEFIKKHHPVLHEELDVPESSSLVSTNVKIMKAARINYSEGGLCLELDPIPTSLESGELLSLILAGGLQMTLTVIKWVRLGSRTVGMVGCELLSVDAEPCVVQIIDERKTSLGFSPALLLDNMKGEFGKPRLIFGNTGDLQGKLVRIILKKKSAVCKLTERDVVTGSILVSQFSATEAGEAFWY